jgi:hypothetical protein
LSALGLCSRAGRWRGGGGAAAPPEQIGRLKFRYFKLSRWSELLILVFEILPSVFCLLGDVSEHVRSIFWVEVIKEIYLITSTQNMETTG